LSPERFSSGTGLSPRINNDLQARVEYVSGKVEVAERGKVFELVYAR